ncbi:DNA cytosine methyltransferase [Cohnella luojiensis]|uniref:Cytosine-specific methyltransferase n=1 Tax=Cohnella luojiensis TaxID=652876 RepID=A0A4Y8LZW0_9BACL|nr:DNA cytosine methyltransferase [Cohnella luojiensis]TFE25597.1 DNA cytosine methyltransferase [Cohnella luojiensis]
MSKFSVVSLFCGAGGLDMGFEKSGSFKTVWANDINTDACETHRTWSKAKVVDKDIKDINFNEVPNTDVILGGFPCQGFSLAGPRKIDDNRNSLYRFFAGLVGVKKPHAFVAENVKGILTLGGDGKILEAIIEDFSDKGYNVLPFEVNAAHYGVPQDRKRVILVGINKELEYTFKMPDAFEYTLTLEDALRNIPTPNEEDICNAPYSSRYMSRNRKRDWNEVSFTIPAMAKQVALHPSSPAMEKIHKDLWKFGEGITRRLSWQEAAAIQTFPPNLIFQGDLISKYKQIGNAVPVELAKVIAVALKSSLDEAFKIKNKNKNLVEVGV